MLNALVNAGYDTSIFSDVADVNEAKRFYPEIGDVLDKVQHVRTRIGKRVILLPGMRMLHMAALERSIYRIVEQEDYDLIVSTQSSIFTGPEKSRMIHFTYDFSDLFVFSPLTRMRDWIPDLEKLKFYSETYKTGRFLVRKMVRKSFGIAKPKPDLIATPSSIILKLLREHGYSNSTTFVPPARQFTPLAKKPQVIQVARIVQAKRLEIFFEAARRLPDVHFILIGRLQEGANLYGKKLLENIPSNLEYIQGNLKDHVDRLRESSVYCYTGRDRAIMLSVAEAISAGCYPIVSADSSALDVADIAKVGKSFRSIDQLVNLLRFQLKEDMDPWAISKYAEPFKPEHFEDWVVKVAKS